MAKARILLIEDDPDIRELIAFNLGREGYAVDGADSGEKGLSMASALRPDVIILDVMLPGLDGLEVLRRLKADKELKIVPVIMATAKGEDSDVVAGLELGADDYVSKPFSPKVLIARVRVALRRRADFKSQFSGADSVLSLHGLRLDIGKHELRDDHRIYELSATDFAILEFLMRNPGWVFSRSQIIDAVKGHDYPVTDRSVDVQILSLRRKLESYGELIETVRGVGYRMRSEG